MAPHSCLYESQSDELPDAYRAPVRAGDVYTVRESIFTPIYDLLRGCLDGDLQVQANAAYHSKLRVQNYKRRPCVLMEDYPQAPQTQMTRRMCLSTTLESHPISALPSIFEDFCIPIYTRTCTSDEHLHSLPEWEGKSGWIIAIVFDSPRRLLGQWGEAYGEMPARKRAFGTKAMDYLKKSCAEKYVEWMRKCRQNPAYVRECFKECRVSPTRQPARGEQKYSPPMSYRRTIRHRTLRKAPTL